MKLKIIHDDDEYQKAVSLREEVLRRPLGLSFSKEEANREKAHIHFGVFDGDKLIATASLAPEGSLGKMQRVAVRPEYQRQGYGKMLMDFIEKEAQDKGFVAIYCHARDGAVEFYS